MADVITWNSDIIPIGHSTRMFQNIYYVPEDGWI